MKNFLAIIFSLFFIDSALAQNDDTSKKVKVFVADLGNSIIQIAGEAKTSEIKKREKIITKIDNVLDANWIARFTLGKNYKTATDPQKTRFLELYRQFMINTYGPKFKNYNGRRFDVLSIEQQSSFYVAKCEFLPHDSDAPIKVDFRVKDRDGKLSVLDFVAEGVSLIETQRSEFNSAISQNGMGKFLDDFAERVRKLKLEK